MKKINMGRCFVRYEKSESEKYGDALLRLAKILIQNLTDEQALLVAELFDLPEENRSYQPGERLRGQDGKLYKVRTAHKAGEYPLADEEVYINLGKRKNRNEGGE